MVMGINRFTLVVACLLLGLFTVRCTHEDVEMDPISAPNPIVRGDDKISLAEGYVFDKAHSSVRWETAYMGTAAMLTGRFNNFSIELDFDENNPGNISIVGKVFLSSVNTGEPNRDNTCLQSTLGTSVNNEAVFTSTNVVFNPKGGYIVTGNLAFHGVTRPVTMQLDYISNNLITSGQNQIHLAGFSGQFEINAKSVFGIESGNIADRVVIKINAQYRHAL
jgi:polyisoprenoid-binding protein YceI